MDFKYQELLKEHGLTVKELPEDAQTTVKELKKCERGLDMLERQGKKPSQSTLKKIKAFDKFVCHEIHDFLYDEDTNSEEVDELDFEEAKDEIQEQLDSNKEESKETPKEEPKEADPKGLKVDAELSALIESGNTSLTIEQIKDVAPTVYNILWETMSSNDVDNGVKTSYYSIIQKAGSDKFTVKKL